METKEFIKYLEAKDLAPTTINYYLIYVELFFKWAKKEDIQVIKPDVLRYLEYLKNKRGQQNVTRKNQLIALKHYFTHLYQREQITISPCAVLKIRGANKKKLHKIYTPDELELLCDNYYNYFVRNYDDSHIPKNQRKYAALNRHRNAVILSVLANQGISTNEIEIIELDNLDLSKATIKIQNKRTAERTLPLKATQIGLLMYYLQNTRPQLLEYQTKESKKLFLPLPKSGSNKTDSETLKYAVKPLAQQVKIIDRQFINFQQVRASVISFWIKTQGLRKAQHLAGHKSIASTENYLPNNIDNLIDDINKMHPFL